LCEYSSSKEEIGESVPEGVLVKDTFLLAPPRGELSPVVLALLVPLAIRIVGEAASSRVEESRRRLWNAEPGCTEGLKRCGDAGGRSTVGLACITGVLLCISQSSNFIAEVPSSAEKYVRRSAVVFGGERRATGVPSQLLR
jgi:hypothetical protein